MVLKRCLPLFFLVLSVFIVSWNGIADAYTDTPATPTTLTGGKIIAAKDAKLLYDAKSATFFDVRPASRYSTGHIPGTANLPYYMVSDKTTTFNSSLDTFNIASLPTDKSKVIVFYCAGPGGWRSYKAAVLAIRQGYKNVYWMRGGMIDWSVSYPVETSPAPA